MGPGLVEGVGAPEAACKRAPRLVAMVDREMRMLGIERPTLILTTNAPFRLTHHTETLPSPLKIWSETIQRVIFFFFFFFFFFKSKNWNSLISRQLKRPYLRNRWTKSIPVFGVL